MTQEEKDKLVDEVINGFDFDKAWSIMYLTKDIIKNVPTIEEMKHDAEKFLRMALEHQDREFWWAGGLNGYGGLCACYDDKWGLSLNYIAVAKKIHIKGVTTGDRIMMKLAAEAESDEKIKNGESIWDKMQLQNEIERLKAKLRDFGCEL